MRADPNPPPFTALLADLDGHVLGVNPGRAIALDHTAVAVTVLHAFRRLGDHFARGEIQFAWLEAQDGVVALTPLAAGQLVLAVVAPHDTDRDRLLACAQASITHQPRPSSDTSRAASLLHFSDELRAEWFRRLTAMLRDLGCPEQALSLDARRRRVAHAANRCCAGAWDEEAERCLARLCNRAGLPPVSDLLGTGSFGSAFALRDGTVLKLTRDENEARATASLEGRKLRRFPNVYRVFRWLAWGRPTGCFGIVRQAVADAGRLTGEMAQAGRTACELLIAMRAENDRPAAERRVAALELGQWERARRFAWEMDEELRAHGISFGDYQPQNLGLLDGELCFFDLSLAVGPLVQIADVDTGT